MGFKMKNLSAQMKRKKETAKCMTAILLCGFFLTACAFTETDSNTGCETPEEAIETTMEAIRTLDMKTFNYSTDNQKIRYRNWLGIPMPIPSEREYKVFSELMHPIRRGRYYRADKRFAEKLTERLEWEVKEVRVHGDKAEIDMEITNIDMPDIQGKIMINTMENMIEDSGTGIKSMIGFSIDLLREDGEMAALMEETDKLCTLEVTVTAFRKQDLWMIHLSDEFINAFMGNIDSEELEESVEKKLEELEKEYEEKMDRWAEDVEKRVEDWSDKTFGD